MSTTTLYGSPYYTYAQNLYSFTKARASDLNTDFSNLQAAFVLVQADIAALNTAAAPLASPALSGIPTAPTAAAGTGGNQIATCGFVAATAFSAALPAQVGAAGLEVTTNGNAASWGITAPGALAILNFIGY